VPSRGGEGVEEVDDESAGGYRFESLDRALWLLASPLKPVPRAACLYQKGVKEEEDEEGTYKAARTTSTHTHPPCNVPPPASQTTRHE